MWLLESHDTLMIHNRLLITERESITFLFLFYRVGYFFTIYVIKSRTYMWLLESHDAPMEHTPIKI